MPKTRQSLNRLAVAGMTSGGGWIDDGFGLGGHSHPWGQLVYAAAGAFAVTTAEGTWVAPFHQVTWIPPGCEHSVRVLAKTDARLVAVPLELCGLLAAHPCVYQMSGLLREAVLALTGAAPLDPGRAERLLRVGIDELADAAEQPLHLPEPRDDRLRAVARLLRGDPGSKATLAELGRACGASERTLSRLFHRELGMGFLRWRTILRVHHSLAHLAEGRSVTAVAIACGWSNPSSFVTAFTAVVGQSPGRYQAALARA
jgi:AraC-like DNA-binding protein